MGWDIVCFKLAELKVIWDILTGPASVMCCKLSYSPANGINDVICQRYWQSTSEPDKSNFLQEVKR